MEKDVDPAEDVGIATPLLNKANHWGIQTKNEEFSDTLFSLLFKSGKPIGYPPLIKKKSRKEYGRPLAFEHYNSDRVEREQKLLKRDLLGEVRDGSNPKTT